MGRQAIRMLNQRGIAHHVVPITAFIILFGIIGAYFFVTGHAAVVNTTIKNGYGQCLDIGSSPAANGAVQAVTCNSGSSQNWQTGNGDGTIRINNLCLGTSNNYLNSNAPIVLTNCQVNNTLWPSVTWTSKGGQLVNVLSGFCLSTPGDTQVPDGTQMVLAPCTGNMSDQAQQWGLQWGTSPKTFSQLERSVLWTTKSGQLVNVADNLCLTTHGDTKPVIPPNNLDDPAKMQLMLEPCLSHTGQQWKLKWGQGTVASTVVTSGYSGFCMDDFFDHPSANTPVQTWYCDKTSSQNWQTGNGDGTIRIHGKCLGTNANDLGGNALTILANCTVSGSGNNTTKPNVPSNVTTGASTASTTKSSSATDAKGSSTSTTQTQEETDLQYLVKTFKSKLNCSQLHSTYARQFLQCK